MKLRHLGKLMLVSVLAAALVTGCGGSGSPSEPKESVEETAAEETVTEEPPEEEAPEAEETEEALPEEEAAEEAPAVNAGSPAVTGQLDASFNLYGKKYTLPMKLTDLEADGWSADGYDKSDTLEGYNYSLIYLERKDAEDTEVRVEVFNPTGNTITLAETSVAGIEVYNYDTEKLQFSLGNGLTPADDPDTVKQTMGEPDSTSDEDDYTMFEYGEYRETTGKITFYWSKDEEKKDSYIELEFFTMEETASSSEVPEYFSKYTAPSALGEDLDSGTFSLDGTLYQVPCPVSELIANGWTVTDDADVPAGGIDHVYLEKNGAEVTCMVENFADYQTTGSNSAAISVEIRAYDDTKIPELLLPKGISMNTDKETLESALEESSVDFDKNETEYSIGYYSSGSDIGYSILYGNEEQRLISVQISNSVWPE
jgi:hypothetical protein